MTAATDVAKMIEAGKILLLICPILLIGLEAARYIHWKLHKDSGIVPSTQHWCMTTTLVAGASGITGLILFLIGIFENS